MIKRYSVRPRAIADIQEHYECIREDDPSAAEAFLDEVRDQIEKLALLSGMGAKVDFPVNDHMNPMLFFFVSNRFRNHLIFYRKHTDSITVVRVLQGSRNDIQDQIRE